MVQGNDHHQQNPSYRASPLPMLGEDDVDSGRISTQGAPKKAHYSHTTSVGGMPRDVVVVVVVDSHIQRIVLATEETTVTQQVSHRPIKCQSRLWSQRGTKVNGSHHGDNPLLRPTGIQIATKSYAALQAMAPTNIKTVHQTSLLHIESNLDRLGMLSPTHDQRSQQNTGKITLYAESGHARSGELRFGRGGTHARHPPPANMTCSDATFKIFPDEKQRGGGTIFALDRSVLQNSKHKKFMSQFPHPQVEWKRGERTDYLEEFQRLQGGDVRLDRRLHTTEAEAFAGTRALRTKSCLALLDTGSPAFFIREKV